MENGGQRSKTEMLLLSCEMSAINLPTINCDICALVSSTKFIGLTIVDKLNNHEHLKTVTVKAARNWRIIRSKCADQWRLSIPTLILLYKTVILAQKMYAAPMWNHKLISDLNKFQNNIIRSIFRHCLSPPFAASNVLLGIFLWICTATRSTSNFWSKLPYNLTLSQQLELKHSELKHIA